MAKNKNVTALNELFEGIDWEVFLQQKISLVAVLNDIDEEVAASIADPDEFEVNLGEKAEHLQGILQFLDAVLDKGEELGLVNPDELLQEEYE